MAIESAVKFAKKKHKNHVRKYTGEPYFNHLHNVAQKVREWGGSDDMIAAAYLHDIVEDTGVHIDGVTSRFGDVVGAYVWWLTDTPSCVSNRYNRKWMDVERLSRAPMEVKIIKCADLIDNTSTIMEYDHKFGVLYMQEKINLLNAFDNLTENISNEVWESVRKHVPS